MHNISGGVPEDVFILFLLLPGGRHSKSYRIDSQIQFWRRFLRQGFPSWHDPFHLYDADLCPLEAVFSP